MDRQWPHSLSDCPIESPSPGSAGLSWLLSRAEPILVMSQFDGSARLKMAQLSWLSHFEPSRGNTSLGIEDTSPKVIVMTRMLISGISNTMTVPRWVARIWVKSELKPRGFGGCYVTSMGPLGLHGQQYPQNTNSNSISRSRPNPSPLTMRKSLQS